MVNKFINSLLGHAIGDAVGVPFEFKQRGSFECKDMVGFGTWNKPAGTYSDDTAMLLCTMDAIASGYNKEKVIDNFQKWAFSGFMSVDNHTFDIGNTTMAAINSHANGLKIKSDEFTNGNGSLMRIIPLASWLIQFEDKKRNDIISEISSITHPHCISVNACIEAVNVAINLLNGKSIKDSIYRHEGLMKKSENQIKSNGYVVNTLEAAFWVLLNTDNFEEAILKAVNLGDDTDTTAAVVGGFAGIFYNIPDKWLSKLRDKDKIINLALRVQKQIHLPVLQ